jgi:hypothetical protein
MNCHLRRIHIESIQTRPSNLPQLEKLYSVELILLTALTAKASIVWFCNNWKFSSNLHFSFIFKSLSFSEQLLLASVLKAVSIILGNEIHNSV